MYIATGKNTPISIIWQHTDHLYYGLFSVYSFPAAYNPLVHNCMQGKQGNKAVFFPILLSKISRSSGWTKHLPRLLTSMSLYVQSKVNDTRLGKGVDE